MTWFWPYRSDQLPQFLQEIHAHLNNDGNHVSKIYHYYLDEIEKLANFIFHVIQSSLLSNECPGLCQLST